MRWWSSPGWRILTVARKNGIKHLGAQASILLLVQETHGQDAVKDNPKVPKVPGDLADVQGQSP